MLRCACVYLTSGLYYWTTATDWFTCCAVNFMWSSFAYMYYGLLIHFAVYEWKTKPGMVSFAFVCLSVCLSVFLYVYVCICWYILRPDSYCFLVISPSQIGHQDRKAGPYGAYFSTEADTIFVVGPGLHLWKAQASNGTVINKSILAPHNAFVPSRAPHNAFVPRKRIR